MKVLITGGAGFIGSHTADALVGKGYDVVLLDNLTEPVHPKNKPFTEINRKAKLIIGDVRDKNTLERALRGVDYVFHFAAYQDYLPDFSKFFSVNAVGTALLYEIIVEKKLPIKKVVVASSQAVYGEGKYLCKKDGVIYPDIRTLEQLARGDWDIICPKCGGKLVPDKTDELRVNPQNQYAVSKYTEEMIALNLGKRYSIPSVALRYSIVQGPKQSFYNAYSGACRIFCLNMFLGRPPVIYEDGMQMRDYVNIEDVVRANLLVMTDKRADYKVFNVGGGKKYTVLEFARIVSDVFGVEHEPLITGEFRFGDTRHIFSDISKLGSLGWKPKFSPRKSVEDYLAWLREYKSIDRKILEYAEKRMKNLGVVRKAKLEDYKITK